MDTTLNINSTDLMDTSSSDPVNINASSSGSCSSASSSTPSGELSFSSEHRSFTFCPSSLDYTSGDTTLKNLSQIFIEDQHFINHTNNLLLFLADCANVNIKDKITPVINQTIKSLTGILSAKNNGIDTLRTVNNRLLINPPPHRSTPEKC
jgi:hypothetical protein